MDNEYKIYTGTFKYIEKLGVWLNVWMVYVTVCVVDTSYRIFVISGAFDRASISHSAI